MKRVETALAALMVFAAFSPLAIAADAPDGGHKSVCIQAYNIDHTEIPDDSTIVFHMYGHKAWKNTLIDSCAGLKNSTRGFTYSPTNSATDEICSNLMTIHVNDTGQTCLLGDFTPVPEPGAH